MERIMKKSLLALFSIISLAASAQVGLSGGASILKAFTPGKPYAGLNFGVEIPRDDEVTFYLKLGTYFKQQDQDPTPILLEARDQNTSPYAIQVNGKYSFNYLTLEGGTRYYLAGTYDYGFGFYGGTAIMAAFNKVSLELDPYDETLYMSPSETKGNIFNFGVGLAGGFKYTFPSVGTFYVEPSATFLALQIASNETANLGYRGSPLIFTVHVGFRKDLY